MAARATKIRRRTTATDSYIWIYAKNEIIKINKYIHKLSLNYE